VWAGFIQTSGVRQACCHEQMRQGLRVFDLAHVDERGIRIAHMAMNVEAGTVQVVDGGQSID
jgi:hypothetical protein